MRSSHVAQKRGAKRTKLGEPPAVQVQRAGVRRRERAARDGRARVHGGQRPGPRAEDREGVAQRSRLQHRPQGRIRARNRFSGV